MRGVGTEACRVEPGMWHPLAPAIMGWGRLGWLVVISRCPHQQRPSDYGIPMDVEMAYVQDSFLTNDILHEMVSSVPGGVGRG